MTRAEMISGGWTTTLKCRVFTSCLSAKDAAGKRESRKLTTDNRSVTGFNWSPDGRVTRLQSRLKSEPERLAIIRHRHRRCRGRQKQRRLQF